MPKPIVFRGHSLDDLRAFPEPARRRAGYQLHRVQHGEDPRDWRPMPSIGAAVREIRVRDASGAYRIVYIATLGDAVYVLHCFAKTTRKTEAPDLAVARQRYRELLAEVRP